MSDSDLNNQSKTINQFSLLLQVRQEVGIFYYLEITPLFIIIYDFHPVTQITLKNERVKLYVC